ncbi:MAG: DUF5519 family protein [Phycisphaerales bacterium]|nr:DUF5519 family protein [Phycisphaerales bacterium]
MRKGIAEIQEAISAALNGLDGVFSSVQWGGRAYKLPGPNGNRKRPKLLAHVCLSEAGDSVSVDFKLEKARAREVVEVHDWIQPHPFRTLAPNGWVSATVRTRSQCKVISKLLAESRRLYPEVEIRSRGPAARKEVSEAARRIELVMGEKRAQGWRVVDV